MAECCTVMKSIIIRAMHGVVTRQGFPWLSQNSAAPVLTQANLADKELTAPGALMKLTENRAKIFACRPRHAVSSLCITISLPPIHFFWLHLHSLKALAASSSYAWPDWLLQQQLRTLHSSCCGHLLAKGVW